MQRTNKQVDLNRVFDDSELTAFGKRNAWLVDFLRTAYRHGSIYYRIESVSRSGMSRTISLYTARVVTGDTYGPMVESSNNLREFSGDNGPEARIVRLWPAHDMSEADRRAIGWQWSHGSSDVRAFRVHGCGMDMVFHLVDTLTHAVFSDHALAYGLTSQVYNQESL